MTDVQQEQKAEAGVSLIQGQRERVQGAQHYTEKPCFEKDEKKRKEAAAMAC